MDDVEAIEQQFFNEMPNIFWSFWKIGLVHRMAKIDSWNSKATHPKNKNKNGQKTNTNITTQQPHRTYNL